MLYQKAIRENEALSEADIMKGKYLLEAGMFAFLMLSEGREGPNTALAWLLYAGAALFLLTIIAGWLTGSKKEDRVEAPGRELNYPGKKKKSK